MIINVTHTFSSPAYLDIIDFNEHLLDTTPHLIDTRGNMIGKLRTFLKYLRDNGSVYIYKRWYTGVSIRKLVKLGGGSRATWEKYIHLWIEHGLLGAPDHSVSENNIFEKNAMEYARLTGNRNATTMYTVNKWTAEQLQGITNTRGSGRKAEAIHRIGKAKADKVWGDRRGISKAVDLAEGMIRRRIEAQISKKGYCTRGDLRQQVHVYRENADGTETKISVDNVFADMRPEIEQRYYYGSASKEQRERWKIGREFVIMRKEDAPERAQRGGAEEREGDGLDRSQEQEA